MPVPTNGRAAWSTVLRRTLKSCLGAGDGGLTGLGLRRLQESGGRAPASQSAGTVTVHLLAWVSWGREGKWAAGLRVWSQPPWAATPVTLDRPS